MELPEGDSRSLLGSDNRLNAFSLIASASSLGVLLNLAVLRHTQMAAVARRSDYYRLGLIRQLHPFLFKKDLASVIHIGVTSQLD